MKALRKPQEKYGRSNGFTAENTSFPLEGVKEGREREATESQELARFVRRELGSFFPPLDEMKRETETSDPIATLTEHIGKLKKEQADGMSKLASYFAQISNDDALDRYFLTDDLKYFDDNLPKDDVWAKHYEMLEELYRLSGRIHTSEQYDLLSRYQYDHLQELLLLYRRLKELKEVEEAARKRREAQFPQTIEEYRSMELKDSRLRVAKFLTADANRREQMRTESQWAWRQTEPLIKEFSTNEEFRRNINNFIRGVETKDPRARAPPA